MRFRCCLLLFIALGYLGPGVWFPRDAVSADFVSVRLPIEFRTWKIRQSGLVDRRVSTWSVPWISTVGLSPATSLVLSGEGLATSLTRPDQSFGDVSEVAAQIRHEPLRAPLTLIASLRVPGTQSDVSAQSREIRQWLSHPLLAMPQDRWGSGVDFGGAAIWAPTVGEHARWATGLGIEVPGAYRVGEVAEYRPGAEYSLSVGLQWQTSPSPLDLAVFRVTGRTYGRDRIDGSSGIREGDQLDATFRWYQSVGQWNLGATTQASWKANAERADPDVFEIRSPGWLGAADLSWIYAGSPFQAGLRLESRRFDGSRRDARYGWSLGAGPVFSAGTRIRIRGEALYLRGRWEEGRTKATGTSVRLTVGYLP